MKKASGLLQKYPFITLAIIAPIFGLAISVNVSPLVFINPIGLIMYVLPYSLGAILCRELALRWKSGLKGLIFLALAFSVLKEALAFRTILNPDMTEEIFKGKDFSFGINWMLTAIFTHAHVTIGIFGSIKLSEATVLEKKNELWLGSRGISACIGGILAWITSAWIVDKFKPPIAQLSIFIFLFLLFVLLAFGWKKKEYKEGEEGEAPPARAGINTLLGFTLAGGPFVAGYFVWPFLEEPLDGIWLFVFFVIWDLAHLLILFFINGKFRNVNFYSLFCIISGTITFFALITCLNDILVFQGNIIFAIAALVLLYVIRKKLLPGSLSKTLPRTPLNRR